jgi:hypothetical protein
MLLNITLNAANVNIKLLNGEIYKGEVVKFEIIANGENIDFPEIDYIGDSEVLQNGTSSSTSIINGVRKREISKRFSFIAEKNIVLPEYIVKIDGKEYKTKKIPIKLSIPKVSSINDNYILKMELKDNEIYMGETTILKVTAKVKENLNIDKISLIPPTFNNLSLKELPNKSKAYSEHGYTVNEIFYEITPNKKGILELNNIVMQIGILDRRNNYDSMFAMLGGGQFKWKKVFSNSLTLNVKEIPENTNIIGKDLIIKSFTDKKKVDLGNPINLTIKISGIGNLEDIDKFELKIKNVTIYTDEPIIKNKVFLQKIAIIGNSDFVIPSIYLKYFNKTTKEIKIIVTEPIKIKVNNINSISNNNIKKSLSKKDISNIKDIGEKINKIPENEKNVETLKNSYVYIIIAIISFLLGYFSSTKMNTLNTGKIKKSTNTDILNLIKKAKTDKELYELLLPYNNNKTVTDILYKLENNIYKKENVKINKQELYNYFGNL